MNLNKLGCLRDVGIAILQNRLDEAERIFPFHAKKCVIKMGPVGEKCDLQRGLEYRHHDCRCSFEHCPRIHGLLEVKP
jgi:hypothetical protein